MTIRIITADVFDGLAQLPDESVHCVVTSPPYFGLRDYSMEGQIGQEPTLGEYVDKIVRVCREIKRALRTDGTFWLNVGDSYAGPGKGRNANGEHSANASSKQSTNHGATGGMIAQSQQHEIDGHIIPRKSLCLVPYRIAIALIDDGWLVRSTIAWCKPNPMPESVTDRPTSSHEVILMLSKSPHYFYNADAVRSELRASSVTRLAQNVELQTGSTRANGGAKTNGTMKAVGGRRSDKQRGHSRRHAGFNDRWDSMSKEEQMAAGANLKNVWVIAPSGYKAEHFATFPPQIPELCIKAGCPKGGVVLDPFAGAGTTGLVADRLQRDAILIELNADYVALIEQRLAEDRTDEYGERAQLLDLMEAEA